MRRFVAAVAIAILLLCSPAYAQGPEQTLVDRATLTVQDLMTQHVSHDPRELLRQARAVIICPQVFKAGFIFGGAGGDCVLLARAGNGTWSYPAFYGIGSGSVGFQIGVQDSEIVMMIMTDRGLNAVMDSQFKLGADVSVAAASVGGSVGGGTTAAVGADIVAFAMNRGLFAGVALDGSIMSLRSDWIRAYYGHPYSAREIVLEMVASNPGADPLRTVLTRYGGGGPEMGGPEPPPPPGPGPRDMDRGPGYAPPPPGAGYAPPAGAAPPPGYAAPPSAGYAPPSAGYAPPAAGYAPPPGYAPPAAGYAPSSGYAPPSAGYAPPPNNQTGAGEPVQQEPLAPPSR